MMEFDDDQNPHFVSAYMPGETEDGGGYGIPSRGVTPFV
jgi:hypothetical protein